MADEVVVLAQLFRKDRKVSDLMLSDRLSAKEQARRLLATPAQDVEATYRLLAGMATLVTDILQAMQRQAKVS